MRDIATVTMTNEILERYDLKAKKKFGQNFLIDANIVDKIAKNACRSDMVCIEIGPGIGSLTQKLARYAKKVYAHEIDEQLLPVLNDIFKDEPKIEIIPGDFLKIDFRDMPYHDETLVVCANLPYYITTPILFKLFESDLQIDNITVMVQKEVADRFRATSGSSDYNALSVIVQYLYDLKYLMTVPKQVFNPRPQVDSAVITFKQKERIPLKDQSAFFALVKNAFRARRKTLYNNLKDTYDPSLILKAMAKSGIKDNARAQELDLMTFVNLYEEMTDV